MVRGKWKCVQTRESYVDFWKLVSINLFTTEFANEIASGAWRGCVARTSLCGWTSSPSLIALTCAVRWRRC